MKRLFLDSNWLRRIIPKYDYFCPKCKKPIPRNSHSCPHCGEHFPFNFAIKTPSKLLMKGHEKELSAYVHKKIFPSLSEAHRNYLAKYFTTFFTNGFEEGDFSEWTGTNTYNSSIVVQSTVKNTDTYAARLQYDYDQAWKNYTAQSECYARCYVRFASLPASGGILSFFALSNSGFDTLVMGQIKNNGGQMQWQITYYNSGWSQSTEAVNATINTDTWYCVELWHKANTANGAKIYIDGSAVITASNTTLNYNCDQVSVLFVSSPSTGFYIYFDDVVVADTYIGVISSSAYPYINNVSDVDSVADIGTHSAFANQQADDANYDTLTEADTDTGTSTFGKTSGSGSSYRTTAANEVRLGVFSAGSSGEVASIVFYGRGNAATVNCKAIITDSSGNLLTNGVGQAVSVNTTAGTKTLTYASGSRPKVVSGTTYWIGVISDGALRVYYDSTTGATSRQDTTNSYSTPTSPTDASSTTETWRQMYANINNENYQLQIEEQFTAVPYSSFTAWSLHVKTGTFSSPAETLNVEIWNGSTWTSLGSVAASTDNTYTVTSYATSANIYIRLRDGTTSNDVTQSTWQIGAVWLEGSNVTVNIPVIIHHLKQMGIS